MKWLRDQERPGPEACVQESDWCAKMKAAADEIEALRDFKGRHVAAEISVVRAARKFTRLMNEFEGELQYCHEAMDEVVDATDRLLALEQAEKNRATWPSQQWLEKHR